MKHVHAILTQDELKRLETVIGEIEATTSGELRLIVARRSTLPHHAGLMLWSLFAVIGSFLWIWFAPMYGISDLLWPVALLTMALVAWGLVHIPFVERFFIPKRELAHQVWARAEVEFLRQEMFATSGRSGILLFLSLFERRAVVLADRGISAKVADSTWDEVVELMVAGHQSDRWREQLELALRLCGEHLKQYFPSKEAPKNELSNSIVLLD